MNNQSPIIDKSYAFAVRIVRAYQHLSSEKREFILSKQLLRSGTSIGANSKEAQGGISKADFSAKLSIAYKEARETKYWIKLLRDTDYFTPNEANSLLNDADELCRLLYSAINTSRPKQ
jgi:four helix bundle protein